MKKKKRKEKKKKEERREGEYLCEEPNGIYEGSKVFESY